MDSRAYVDLRLDGSRIIDLVVLATQDGVVRKSYRLPEEQTPHFQSLTLHAFLKEVSPFKLHAFNRNPVMQLLQKYPWSVPRVWWGECVMEGARELMRRRLPRNSRGTTATPSLYEAARFFRVGKITKGILSDIFICARLHEAIRTRDGEMSVAYESRDFFP